MSATRRRLVLGAALMGAVACASLFLPTSPHRASNIAWTDPAATQASRHAVSDLATQLFTVTPASVPAVRAAARQDLSGAAVGQFQKLYGPVLTSAKHQQLALTTVLRAVGVTRLTSEAAELLVIADQTATAAGQSRSGPATLRLEASHGAHGWTISSITVL